MSVIGFIGCGNHSSDAELVKARAEAEQAQTELAKLKSDLARTTPSSPSSPTSTSPTSAPAPSTLNGTSALAPTETPRTQPTRQSVAGRIEIAGPDTGKMFNTDTVILSEDGTFFYQVLVTTYRGTWDINNTKFTMTATTKATGIFENSKPITDPQEQVFSKDSPCTFDGSGRLTSCENWRGKQVTIKYLDLK